MKNFMQEFKDFALKGNVMDMAVGVIIGAAFKGIVDSFVNDIINPIIGLAFQTDFSNVVIPLAGDASINIGTFISAVLNFVLMALILFVLVKAVNKLNRKPKEEQAAPVKSDEVKALEEIVTLLKNQK